MNCSFRVNFILDLFVSDSRTVASTNMNAVSSRSHAVFTMVLTEKKWV